MRLRNAFVAAAVVMLAGTLPASAAVITEVLTKPAFGISASGTWGFAITHTSPCPGGYVLTGVDTQSNDGVLSGITPICRDFSSISPTLEASGALFSSTVIGESGTSGGTGTCGAGDAVVGFRPRPGEIIDGFRIVCQGFDDHQAAGATSESGDLGGTGGTLAADPTLCDPGQVVTEVGGQPLGWNNHPAMGMISFTCSDVAAVGSTFVPDAMVNGTGDGVTDNTGATQTVTKKIKPGKSVSVFLILQNDGDGWDTLRLTGDGSKSPFSVKYKDDSGKITTAVKEGTYTYLTTSAVPDNVTLDIKAKSTAKKGTKRTFIVDLGSVGTDTYLYDRVKVVAIVK